MGKRAVASKVKPQAKSKGKRANKAAKASALEKAGEDKQALNDQKNFLTQGKNSKDQTMSKVYSHYMTLGRFDSEKKAILDMWKKDKSCKWFVSYEKTKSQCNATSSKGLKGFGTQCLNFK
jgi:hypothetical protein